MKKAYAVVVVLGFLLQGCSTMFLGSAYVRDGVKGCEAKCTEWGMEVAGMIAMGEYSDACVCQLPGKQVDAGGSSVVGAVAGVAMQVQQMQQQTHHY